MSVSDATSAASVEDEEMSVTLREVSGIDDNTGDNTSDDNASNVDDEETEEDMFLWVAREIMNWLTKKLGMAAMEDRQICSFFGMGKEIILKVWGMLGEGGLRPKNSKPKHLL
jgi:hypothetical protein